MPKQPVCQILWLEEQQTYQLLRNGHVECCFVQGSEPPEWFQFLESQTSFAFQGRAGRLSIIKETRPRGAGYWYAYRTVGRRTTKRYLGSTSGVTIARLEKIARELYQVQSEERNTPPLLLTRLRPPRLSASLLDRPHLLQRLDSASRQKLTLLVAPAGSGKTTLVNQWLQTRDHAVAWVSLDRGDNDVFRFWKAVITASQTLQPGLGRASLEDLSRSLQPPFIAPPLETALSHFINDLAQFSRPGLLVLDDYHTIEEPRIHEMLAFFLEHIPPHFSVFLLSRTEPLQLPLLRWRARGDISELHHTDLFFSQEETAHFLRQALSTSLSEEALRRLHETLQGWIAGLRLLMLSFPASSQATEKSIEQALASLDRPLQDYFVTEILKALPEPTQHFLLQTSVLSRLNGPLCEAVTGIENGAAQLKAIAQAGLFLEALDETWYCFHALFAEAMRREATIQLGEEALRRLSLQASHWYEHNALPMEAIETALAGHDFERAAFLIEQINQEGLLNELYTVRRWLECLPEPLLHAHPELCWLAALTLQVPENKTAPSAPIQERTEALLQRAEQANMPAGHITALRALIAWRGDHFSEALHYAQQALPLLPPVEQPSSLQVWRGMCLFIISIGHLYNKAFTEARTALLEAYTYGLATNHRHFTDGLLLLIGFCSYTLGDLYQAYEYYQQALHGARDQQNNEIAARSLLGMAGITFMWNNLSLAEQQTNEALALVGNEHPDIRDEATLQLAQIAHACGHLTSAQQQVSVVLARLQLQTTVQAAQKRRHVQIYAAQLSLQIDDQETVNRLLLENEPHDQDEALLFGLLRARLLLAQQRVHEALQQLRSLVSLAQEWPFALEIHILYALVHATLQEEQAARQQLQQALELARNAGIVRPFLAEGEPLIRLLRHLLPTLQEPTRSYAKILLRAFAQAANKETSSAADQLIEPLTPQELSILRLLATGRSNQEIAQAMVISVNTVKYHTRHLYRKLGVNNRLQASKVAQHLKLI
uniref:HTH-type transcriptional regulator MalT n=1 Tax=Thermosporothrix sp. COM3 TaxID=2490863 RepID=A0A455SFD2_9CHLR|nr:HTH-type transcriptional regulator MalT [Thermosporothrix sp. COM3]